MKNLLQIIHRYTSIGLVLRILIGLLIGVVLGLLVPYASTD
jgi:Na+/serine symporter